VTGQSGFDGGAPNGAHDAATGISPADREVLKEGARQINEVLDILDEAEQTPDLLDRIIEIDRQDPLRERSGAEGKATEGKKIPRAERLYLIALKCRKTVRDIKENLYEVHWTEENEGAFQQAFVGLVDAWTAYKGGLDYYHSARWDGEPTPVQALAALGSPRRQYIIALDAYRAALNVVVSYL
jgi:hypothetical protein